MELFEDEEWRIEYDRLATEQAYKHITEGGPERCGCDPCLNWAATRIQLLPEDLKSLLCRLGIPSDKEVEVYHCGRNESGLHNYVSWYHFVGRVLSVEDLSTPPLSSGEFVWFFNSKPVMLNRAFEGQPVVQLEIVAKVPWLSDIPELE
jgi:hypothetical protein